MGWQEFLQKEVLYCWVFCIANNSFVLWNHPWLRYSAVYTVNIHAIQIQLLKDMLAKQIHARQNQAASLPLNFKLNSLYFVKQSFKLRPYFCTHTLPINYFKLCPFIHFKMWKQKTCNSNTHIFIYLTCNDFELKSTKGHSFMVCYF